jgi:type IV pilus assembly protein PilW
MNGGWGLAELMVALAVGAIVTLFASSLLIGANAALTAQAEVAALDDTGRYVLATIGRAVRQAGWGLDAASSEPGLQWSGEALRIAFAGAPDGSILNCAGAAEEDDLAWSVFHLDGDALRCKYRTSTSWSAQTMAHGVEDLRFDIGVDTDPVRDGIANQWLAVSDVAAWGRVTHVRVSFVLKGRHGRIPFGMTYRLENLP